ncbi:hypothetical protein [Phaeobacter sp. HF9A]|uniref:hypothetical protein n=1 Tax=Phaeobacter sp. HF9A TaxID=2721561 RepID=UPI00143083A3|nr:hypothetical protein [Phaeobacter sp. HF9A]NIZ13663.1 hypothetical protein [Phaeobacter sp. HF9A]
MPQADLYYSADLALDGARLLATVETVIQTSDSSAGACKGRAFAVEVTHHRHVLLQVALLEKPHRDSAFLTALQNELARQIAPQLPESCGLGIELRFLSPQYLSVTT